MIIIGYEYVCVTNGDKKENPLFTTLITLLLKIKKKNWDLFPYGVSDFTLSQRKEIHNSKVG
jgi:hypothetical protein